MKVRGYDDLIRAATQAHAAGRLDEAARFASEALGERPDDPDALFILGILAVKMRQPSQAIGRFEAILRTKPDSFDALFWLSYLLRTVDRPQEAAEMASRAVAVQPGTAPAWDQLGLCQLDLGAPYDALASFQRACELSPDFGAFHSNLALALQAVGRNGEAIEALQRALAAGFSLPGTYYRLGDAYMIESQPEPAAECASAILQKDPNSRTGTLLMARALIGSGKVEEGARFAQKAIGLAPGNAVPVAYFGRALQSLGRIEEADEQFRRSIELEPNQGFAYHSLVHNHKVKPEERPLVEQMERLVAEGRLPKRELIQLQYGLGKAHEDLGEYESAMRHFDEANRIDHEIKVGVAPFSREQLEETARFLIETFTPELLDKREIGSESEKPLFVVGMMRSGTTLAEQILSSHRDVGGAGELLFWPDNAGSSAKIFRGSQLDALKLKNLAGEYLKLLDQLSPGKQRVVDKMNTNYLLLGLLHIAFPKARIVHMKRHPVDTCLSIWATPVANGIDLCGSKEHVVFQYRQYLRIMEHWASVLPPDRLLTVQYEELCSDREAVTHRMIEFCGLEWDDACLAPEKNERSVKTPSVWQVRQPVYKTSMERWRKYEPWLGAFAELF